MRRKLIAVDGDLATLNQIETLARPWFDVLTTRSATKAAQWMQLHAEVAAVVCEHVMADASGVAVLEGARAIRPTARRVLVTCYTDLAGIVEGLHSGVVERLVPKPLAPAELLAAIRLDPAWVHPVLSAASQPAFRRATA